MKTPIHRWKQFITYADGREPHWTFDGKPCWLASGVTDKKGVEIFEGDLVKVTNERGERTGLVTYREGHFGVEGASIYARLEGVYGGLEVIGHADD